jgi:hypothetical protein
MKTELIDLLREAFDAGMACAAAYEHGAYSVNFKKWCEENETEINKLTEENEQLISKLSKRDDEYSLLYNDYANHDHTINDLRQTMFHTDAYVETLHNYIVSDSVYTLLRYGSKSSTIVDGMDDHYVDLLNISEQLRAADAADVQNRNDAFDQQLP